MVTISDIHAAWQTISDTIQQTPVHRSTRLGTMAGDIKLWLKAESLQRTGSFKVRGALNRIRNTPAEELGRGVITISAGNHAQGVAWAAAAAGVPATVLMLSNASTSKVAATRGYGAEVILLEGTMGEAFEELERQRVEKDLMLVHPFDDELLIAGQGTVGLEIMEQVPDVDVIVCPIGGGGLISGVAVAAKAISPDVKIYGVEPEGAAAMRKSWDAGSPQHLETIDTIADGLSAPMAGNHTYRITRELLEDIIVVSDKEIAIGLRELLASAKLYAEPAGAVATGALLAGKVPVESGQTVVSIVSGGNLDIPKLVEIMQQYAI
jgi:threonine dehydratase